MQHVEGEEGIYWIITEAMDGGVDVFLLCV